MAEKKSLLSKEEKAGLATEEKGVVVKAEDRMPTNPALKRMTKAQHIEWKKGVMEKKQAMKEFSQDFDKKKKAKAEDLGLEKPAPEEAAAAPAEKPKKKKPSKKKS